MNQRLLWNFEFAPSLNNPFLEQLQEQETDSVKWEARYFWPEHEIIVLNTIQDSLLDLAHYQQKNRTDYYYLLPDGNYNIKRRRDELIYKPLVKQAKHALGFGAKVNLESEADAIAPHLQEITQLVAENATEVFVKKVAFLYKFSTSPKVKLELARLEVMDKIYFSACIEGKSLNLVETIAEHLLGNQVSCDYVSFLKTIMPL